MELRNGKKDNDIRVRIPIEEIEIYPDQVKFLTDIGIKIISIEKPMKEKKMKPSQQKPKEKKKRDCSCGSSQDPARIAEKRRERMRIKEERRKRKQITLRPKRKK